MPDVDDEYLDIYGQPLGGPSSMIPPTESPAIDTESVVADLHRRLATPVTEPTALGHIRKIAELEQHIRGGRAPDRPRLALPDDPTNFPGIVGPLFHKLRLLERGPHDPDYTADLASPLHHRPTESTILACFRRDTSLTDQETLFLKRALLALVQISQQPVTSSAQRLAETILERATSEDPYR